MLAPVNKEQMEYRRVTNNDVCKIRELYRDGLSWHQLAEAFGATSDQYATLNRIAYSARISQVNVTARHEIKLLYQQGKQLKEIANQVGKTVQAVKLHLHRMEMNRGGERS